MNEVGRTNVSVQHRCQRMRNHMRQPGDPGYLPTPCDACYSLIETTVKVPFMPPARSREVVTGRSFGGSSGEGVGS